jgi:hypothetical protein
VLRPALIALALLLVSAESAAAGEFTMRVNELDPSAGTVELLDVSVDAELSTWGEGYTVRSYDAAGNDVAAREYTRPVPWAGPSAPFVLSLPLAAGAGQVCFENPRGEGTLPPVEYRLHCMGYGDVTNAVIRRLQLGRRRLPMPVAALPGPGQSVQRQSCGKAAVAPATVGAENASVPAACAGEPTACDDPRKTDVTTPRMKVVLPRVHDVDRPLVMKVTMDEQGDVTVRGGYIVDGQRQGVPFGPIRRVLRASVTARIRLPIPATTKRGIKRAARRGRAARGSAVSIGRDNACFFNRFHSSRSFKLVP